MRAFKIQVFKRVRVLTITEEALHPLIKTGSCFSISTPKELELLKQEIKNNNKS